MSSTDQDGVVMWKQNKAPFMFLLPLVYAPVLPLITCSVFFVKVRIGLRRNPVVRDRLFTAVLACAVAHGFYLVFDRWITEIMSR